MTPRGSGKTVSTTGKNESISIFSTAAEVVVVEKGAAKLLLYSKLIHSKISSENSLGQKLLNKKRL